MARTKPLLIFEVPLVLYRVRFYSIAPVYDFPLFVQLYQLITSVRFVPKIPFPYDLYQNPFSVRFLHKSSFGTVVQKFLFCTSVPVLTVSSTVLHFNRRTEQPTIETKVAATVKVEDTEAFAKTRLFRPVSSDPNAYVKPQFGFSGNNDLPLL